MYFLHLLVILVIPICKQCPAISDEIIVTIIIIKKVGVPIVILLVTMPSSVLYFDVVVFLLAVTVLFVEEKSN